MPLYEYRCKTCGMTFERRRHFNDAPVEHCPLGHSGVQRTYSAVGIVFKGSGWYITDHRKSATGANTSEA